MVLRLDGLSQVSNDRTPGAWATIQPSVLPPLAPAPTGPIPAPETLVFAPAPTAPEGIVAEKPKRNWLAIAAATAAIARLFL